MTGLKDKKPDDAILYSNTNRLCGGIFGFSVETSLETKEKTFSYVLAN